MAHPGIRTRFKLDDSVGTLTDISTYLDSIQGSGDTSFDDGTNFQPDADPAIRDEIPGLTTNAYSLTGKWSSPAHDFWTGINGKQNLNYEYRPDDFNLDVSIAGLCSCGSYSGPQASVDGVITYSAELRVKTQVSSGSPGSP